MTTIKAQIRRINDRLESCEDNVECVTDFEKLLDQINEAIDRYVWRQS